MAHRKTDARHPNATDNTVKDPEDWTTGDEPMTGAQRSYLRTLCEEAGEPMDESLTKAQAAKRIDQLQQQTGRGMDAPRSPNPSDGESRPRDTGSSGNTVKDPEDWTTGDEPMTGAQRSYLRTLCEEAGEPMDESLTKAQASERISELQQRTGRGTARGGRN
jgi:predicted secreted protein